MKEIVIVSGKGGVGKSTISASLGVLLRETHSVVLADADVDAPNLALFFDAEQRTSRDIQASEKACIDPTICTGCLACAEACRFSSIAASGVSTPVIIPYSCEGCGACAIVCPAGAIGIKGVVNGRVKVSEAEGALIVTGELVIGESSSGRLVDEVKEAARQEAERVKADLLITDGPPGIGCPVIAAVRGGDYVIAATESTPAAARDLRRLLDVIGHFRAPCGIVINKADLHAASRDAIRELAKARELDILAEIPYDKHIPEAIAATRPVVTAYPEAPASVALRRLGGRLSDELMGTSRRSPAAPG
jgi:MinD superfamily P-loop ATPase